MLLVIIKYFKKYNLLLSIERVLIYQPFLRSVRIFEGLVEYYYYINVRENRRAIVNGQFRDTANIVHPRQGNEDKQSKKCNITQKIKKMSSTYSIEKQVANLDANRCNAASCFRFIVKRIPRHFLITSTWARNSLLCCLCLYHSNAINVLRGHSLIVRCLSAILSAKSPVVAAVSKSETTDAIVVKLRVMEIPSLNMIS